PQRAEERREHEDERGVHRLVPARRNREPEEVPARAAIRPELERVPLLLVHGPEEHAEERDRDERGDDASIAAPFLGRLLRDAHRRARRAHDDVPTAEEVDEERDAHAHAGAREAVVHSDLLPERSAHERREERARVDAHVEDRERLITAWIALAVERA